jgi:hypothetical protein
MIRRDVVRGERDQTVVKWALVAAVFALTVGCVAEVTLAHTEVDAAVIAGQSVKAEATKDYTITG